MRAACRPAAAVEAITAALVSGLGLAAGLSRHAVPLRAGLFMPVPGGIENIVVVPNFSDTDIFVDVNFPLLGRWTDLLSGFTGGRGWSVDVAASPAPVPAGSHWGRVFWYCNPSP